MDPVTLQIAILGILETVVIAMVADVRKRVHRLEDMHMNGRGRKNAG